MENLEMKHMSPSPEYWATRRVLVTGASGMVGSWLTRWLVDAGAHAVVLVADSDPASELFRSGYVGQCSVVNGRLEVYEDVERAINNHEVDLVFHLGAQPIVGAANRSPRHTFESNIQGTWNVLESVRLLGGLVQGVVVASSDKAYGTQDQLPYTEDMSMNGVHPYEVSKSCTDLLARSYAQTFGLPVTIARCGNIFGGGDLNWNRIVPGTFRSIVKQEQPVLRSDGTFVRDYLHVDDIVHAYLLLGERTGEVEMRGQAFNFSNEAPLTVLEIFEAICTVAGFPDLSPKIMSSAHGEIRDQYLDATKARNLLGWSPSVSLNEGLSKTWNWYREFFKRENEQA